MPNDNKHSIVLEALEDKRYKWRTTRGISAQVGLPKQEVLQVITDNSDEIVQSSIPSSEGYPLYTTRARFQETSSTLEKLIGAFKGRIR